MLTKLKAFLKTEKAFFENVSLVFGGKMYAAILGILLTPILARLFTPENYGEYALFYAAVQHLVIIGTLSLPIAVSTSKNEEVNATFNLALASILVFSAIIPFIIYPSAPWLDTYFNTSIFTSYQPLILASYILSALFALLSALNIKLQRFKQNTVAGVGETTGSKLINVGSGWLAMASFGLILGDLGGKFVSLGILVKTFPKEIKIALPSLKRAITQLKNFKQFPAYIMPSEWIGMLNNQLLLLVVAFLFTKNELGQLVMAIALLSIPLNILTNTFQPVITERLTSYKGTPKDYPFFTQSLILLSLISIFTFGLILIIPSQAFVFFLGEQWVGIGTIINILAILYFFLLIDRSFENGFIVLGKQKVVFFFSVVELLVQLGVSFITLKLGLKMMDFVMLIVSARGLMAFFRIIYLRQHINPHYSP